MDDKRKAIVFGAMASGCELYKEIERKYIIVALADNDEKKWGGEIYNKRIISPETILDEEWEEIIIIIHSAMRAVKKQLLHMGICEDKINTSYIDFEVKARETFLKDFAKIVYERKLVGAVGEAGVFQGEFAQVINENFPDRECYLFDTFEGFDERDIVYEKRMQYSDSQVGHLNITSEELVISKMKYPEKCYIKKGYFPETAKGIDEVFCLVNLDMDLYKPTLEGLFFFWPRMASGGIILIHDYYSEGFKGVKEAVKEFLDKTEGNVVPFPIGDNISLAIQKK